MSAAGMQGGPPVATPDPTVATDVSGATHVVNQDNNGTPQPATAYAIALGNNGDVISVNDPLALANFLPGPAPAEVIVKETTPAWLYFLGGAYIIYLIHKKGGI